jgi:hypothetical protein
MPMPSLPPSLVGLLVCFRGGFTAPTFKTFCALVAPGSWPSRVRAPSVGCWPARGWQGAGTTAGRTGNGGPYRDPPGSLQALQSWTAQSERPLPGLVATSPTTPPSAVVASASGASAAFP